MVEPAFESYDLQKQMVKFSEFSKVPQTSYSPKTKKSKSDFFGFFGIAGQWGIQTFFFMHGFEA